MIHACHKVDLCWLCIYAYGAKYVLQDVVSGNCPWTGVSLWPFLKQQSCWFMASPGCPFMHDVHRAVASIWRLIGEFLCALSSGFRYDFDAESNATVSWRGEQGKVIWVQNKMINRQVHGEYADALPLQHYSNPRWLDSNNATVAFYPIQRCLMWDRLCCDSCHAGSKRKDLGKVCSSGWGELLHYSYIS